MKLLVLSSGVLLAASLVACPSPKMPSGPPPEYEEPPPPSWLKDAGATPPPSPAAASVDAWPDRPPG